MARLTEDKKTLILADFHTGYFSQRKLADKYEVSTATINKLTKGIEPKHLDKVNAQVSINTALSVESEQEVNAVHSIVNARTKYLLYFQNSAIKGQDIANKGIANLEKMIKKQEDENDGESILATTCMNIIKDHATITKMNKETVLGKEVDTPPPKEDEIETVEIL